MPAYALPQRQSAPPAVSEAAPSEAPSLAEPGTPEWMNSYNLAAGNSAALEAIIGIQADESLAIATLDGNTPETQTPTDAAGTRTLPATPAAPPTPEATPAHAPTGTMGTVYRNNDRRSDEADLRLTNSQRGELARFRTNWERNHARYEAVAARTGIPARLIAAIHYRESSMNFNTYLHQGDPLGRPAVHHPSNIPVFYVWEEAAVHALNMKRSLRDSMGMDATTTDPAALATFSEGYNGLGYHYRDDASPYVWGGTDQYTGGRFVADGVYDRNSFDQRLGTMALIEGLDGAASGPAPQAMSPETAWQAVRSGSDVLRMGSSGPAVNALQGKLGIGVDGDFGNGTKNAVIAFQTAHGIKADGVVGSGTAAAIDGGTAPTSPQPQSPSAATQNPEWARVLAGGMMIHRGDEGEHVRMLQEKLNAAGFACGIDGDFGGGTERAVFAFQRARRLGVDGVVGRATAQALG